MHTEVQQDAAVFHSCSELIDAPVSLVYGIISDVERWPEWQSTVSRTLVEGACLKGREFKWNSSGMTFRALVHTAEEPSEFGWVARSMWFKIVFNCTLEDLHGRTRVTIEESLSGLGAELLATSFRSTMQLTLMELKKHIESLAVVHA